MTERDALALARALGRRCLARGVVVATAESCTGGGVAEAITRIPGSSAWFDRAFVTYSNAAKREMLGVKARSLERHGAVSGEVASQMARGALARSDAQVAVAVTGVAGPGGGSRAKPVGTVWFAWASRGGAVQARKLHLQGGRGAIRLASVCVSLQGLIDLLG